MVISHKYKYVFIETPQTGCSAIRNELIDNYSGESILRKHSVYSHFLINASEEEKNYFVFSSIRNPLDKVVSTYLKFKTNHRNRFTNELSKNWRKAIFEFRNRIMFKKINNAEFSYNDYLKNIYPYDDISTLDHKKFNFILRYETLDEDFERVLQLLDIKQTRELPKYNATASKKNFMHYYIEKETQLLAFKKFAIFMDYWNYEYPKDWGTFKIKVSQKLKWRLFHFIRIFTWGYFRKNIKN